MAQYASRYSPLALVVLAMLTEAPMHAYRIQQLIKLRGKDEVVNVKQRNSLYQTIERLQRDALIAVRETERDGAFPERTVYDITDVGRDTARMWLREQLAQPAREFPSFPAALSVLPLLSADDARRQLEARAAALEAELARLDETQDAALAMQIPRLFLLDGELMRATLEAELDWVRSVVEHLKVGALTWSEAWLREVAARFAQADSPDSE
ncbi:PadR family transcriptional regulator [Burkholderia thailandensis]|uniref:Transcriptional regulator, PadR family n=1 Tax=Burkholderia thailandensis (strain ATCC 700388 / DSM 13276 / CCUG 48851 / CIP 106301 / E264) TaxID=271848 RepID=Q2STG5_BURTA|nr:PadR family transcriptional regulator [Burkholderia thailandensis]ABC38612.1 transcriptional regulator, PadR family [Burkholderia thailandensis E264]AHI72656.1 transcriptional regulator PadR-like family protein [Burkholderia thailandensis 2002721723]AHI80041.1 transcriptional regulator PadR-like family protein [Burkholderia thailandensis E444]AIC88649.1 transcriptional regulator PadR-like family protein [Burkholderia thailandensis USAMRU Malaysia \